MKYIDIYVFGEAGPFDEYNPFRIFENNQTHKIILEIAKKNVLTVNDEYLKNILDLPKSIMDEILSSLLKANLLCKDKDYYKLGFPMFVEEDIEYIDKFSKIVSSRLGDIIYTHKNEYEGIANKYSVTKEFGIERVLYHTVGDKVFDGSALDYFSDKNLFAISKKQPMGRDYLVIGYEKTHKIESYSNNLLCSSNNYRVGNITFNSFGDSMGNRKDFYRYFRRIQSSIQSSTEHLKLNEIYNDFISQMNKKLMNDFEELLQRYICNKKVVFTEEEISKLRFLEEIEYIEIYSNTINHKIPIFTKSLLEEISDLTLGLIEDEVINLFKDLNTTVKGLRSVIHGVAYNEIANELWHQVFGNINEYLVKCGFFSNPEFKEGEGRYLKALYIWS